MSDPLTAASIATLIFTTAVGTLTESLTEEARQKLGEKLKALKRFIASRFQGKAQEALVAAEQGSKPDIERVSNYLGVAMDEDETFAGQVKEMAQEIQQIISIGQVKGQNVQQIFGGEGYQVNHSQGPVIQGGSGNTIHINTGNN